MSPICEIAKTIILLVSLAVLTSTTILPARMLRDLGKRANDSMTRYGDAERAILDSRIHLNRDSPSWYLGASHEMTKDAQEMSRRALRSETMALMIVEALNMTSREAASVLPSVGASLCPSVFGYFSSSVKCGKDDSNYRRHSGRCNNLLHPSWGAALEAYSRILPAEYEDGVSLPRTNLPSAREVSSRVHSGGEDLRHPYLMALTALFGQFVSHDFTHTPRMELPNGERLKCCDVEYDNFHPECFPIAADNEIGCMEYSRSAPHPGLTTQGCKLGPRQQINQATSYLDLSGLYGSDENVATSLRSGGGGKLKTQRNNLPIPSNPGEMTNCRGTNSALPCFRGGDTRINENPGLTLLHVLFMREHNRIADDLAKLNPQWDDERLYQESRRINIAQYQHIVFNEFLPIIFGERSLDKFDLRLTPEGNDYRGYDVRADATVSNAGASAGLFFVAALTPKTLDLVDSRSSEKSGERSLLSAFYAPQELYEAGAIDRLIVGATAGHSRKPLPPALNEILVGRYLHDGRSKDAPVDYAAQTIQQGRDHGLPPYTRWRSTCGLPEVREFHDLRDFMTVQTIDKLKQVYRNVEDIDLVSGALSEEPIDDSVFGPTFLCLLSHTFRNSRVGDRFWYENTGHPFSLSKEQLHELRKATMANILCRNGDRIKKMQPRAFLLKDPFLNDMTDCSIHAAGGVNLTAWKDSRM